MTRIDRNSSIPNFGAWSLDRLIAEARRLGVPSLKTIVKQESKANAKRDLVDILTEAYS